MGPRLVRSRQRSDCVRRELGAQPRCQFERKGQRQGAFNYSDAYQYANPYDDPQYGDSPIGCGTQIYLTKAPTLADIIRAILSRYLLVDSHIVRHPIPDPPPDWSAKLLESLDVADALAQRFAAIEGRAVGDLIEKSVRNAAEIAKAGDALAAQRDSAKAKKAGKASARRR